MEHQHEDVKMVGSGFALGVASGLQPKGKFQFLQNIRIITEGALESRPKVFPYLSLNPPLAKVPHTIKTIVNKITGGINRIVGVDTEVYTGNADPLIQKVSGFSGKP